MLLSSSNTDRRRVGFTLVELLVVIAIIGLLSTVAVVATGSAKKQSRNVKRIADIRQLVIAFSLGLNTVGSYPYNSPYGLARYCLSTACTTGWSFSPDATVDAFFQPYMAKKPTDPNDNNSRTAGGYMYWGAWDGGGTFAPGTYIFYLLEPPATCGIGTTISTTSNYVQCAVLLN